MKRKSIILNFLFCSLWAILLICCESNKAKNRDISNNDRIESQGENPVAVLSDKIVERPNDPNLYIKRATLYTNQKMFDLATRDVERALAVDSTVSYFHQVLGEVKFKEGQLRQARLALEKAVKLDESNTDALLKLAEVNFLLRRYDEALRYTNNALKIDDKLAQGYFIKGYIYKELGDTTLAMSSFHTATEVNPEHYEAYMELGHLSAYRKEPLAIEYFNTALTLRPKSAEALYNKGMYLQSMGKYDEAKRVYRKLIDVDPDNFLGYYNTGYLYLTEYQKFDTALAYFDSVLAVQPGYIDAVFNSGLCFEEMGRESKAVEVYKLVLEQDPQYDLAAKGLERLLE